MFYHFSDSKYGVGETPDEDLRFREVEFAVQGYILPGVRAEFFPVWEVEEEKVEIEESFVNFLTLPLNSNLLVGRHRIRFGLVNPDHQHHRDYSDVPLAVQNILGAEGYIDEGIDFSIMAPKLPIPVEIGFGIFDGAKSLAEAESGDANPKLPDGKAFNLFEKSTPVTFDDHVFLAKINTNLLLLPNLDISMGYHGMWDGNGSGDNVAIHNGQFQLRYRVPNSWSKILWQNEIYVTDLDERTPGDEDTIGDRNVSSTGFYSLLKYTHNRFFDFAFRYDWSELGNTDDSFHWALNPIVTWHFTESTYLRAQYRYAELGSNRITTGSNENSTNQVFLQMVWGLGPHAHGIQR